VARDKIEGNVKAWFIGGGVGSLAGAAFMIRDGGIPGKNITVLEELPVNGGSCDGGGDPDGGFVVRGGRMMNLPTYECTWALFKDIPSLTAPGMSVYEEILDFNERVKTRAKARLVNRQREKVDVETMGFSFRDRVELLRLTKASEEELGDTKITDWFSPDFFQTNFWYLWSTTFAFQPWHSALELKLYMDRFLHEFYRINTLEGVARTPLNQYESLVLPLQNWLEQRGVRFEYGCRVTDLDIAKEDGLNVVKGIVCERKSAGAAKRERITVGDGDLVFMQNGSMTECSSLGSMKRAPKMLGKDDGSCWGLWERIAEGRPEFGNPRNFDERISESVWESFTVTLKDNAFVDKMVEFSGNKPGTGALVTFKDSNWLMSVVLAYQPHFRKQPEGVKVFWGYGLFPDRVGNFVPKKMSDCTGEEILAEICGHLGFEPTVFAEANCIPCMMPYITSMFLTRAKGDRPLPVPAGTKNLGFISQFVEVPKDVVFTVEFSVRAAQMAVYQILGIDKKIPEVSRYDRSLKIMRLSLRTAYRRGRGPRRSKATEHMEA
jgi:oleate hydratase